MRRDEDWDPGEPRSCMAQVWGELASYGFTVRMPWEGMCMLEVGCLRRASCVLDLRERGVIVLDFAPEAGTVIPGQALRMVLALLGATGPPSSGQFLRALAAEAATRVLAGCLPGWVTQLAAALLGGPAAASTGQLPPGIASEARARMLARRGLAVRQADVALGMEAVTITNQILPAHGRVRINSRGELRWSCSFERPIWPGGPVPASGLHPATAARLIATALAAHVIAGHESALHTLPSPENLAPWPAEPPPLDAGERRTS